MLVPRTTVRCLSSLLNHCTATRLLLRDVPRSTSRFFFENVDTRCAASARPLVCAVLHDGVVEFLVIDRLHHVRPR